MQPKPNLNPNPHPLSQGILGGHAYSFLGVHVLDPKGPGKKYYGPGYSRDDHTILRLRNPHGMKEWTGKWSSKDVETWGPQGSALRKEFEAIIDCIG